MEMQIIIISFIIVINSIVKIKKYKNTKYILIIIIEGFIVSVYIYIYIYIYLYIFVSVVKGR